MNQLEAKMQHMIRLSAAAERQRPRCVLSLAVLVALLMITACRTPPRPLPPVDVSEPGWKLREGQALWRSTRDAPEIAGEVTLAWHADGRSSVQFTKTPLPFLSAQTTKGIWRIEFIPEHRAFSGRGSPPAHFIWLALGRSLNGIPPPAPLRLEKLPDGGVRLMNPSSGEALTVYYEPGG